MQGGWDAPLKRDDTDKGEDQKSIDKKSHATDEQTTSNSTTNNPLGKYSPPDEFEESCYFIRDMNECMREWWRDLMEGPGRGWYVFLSI